SGWLTTGDFTGRHDVLANVQPSRHIGRQSCRQYVHDAQAVPRVSPVDRALLGRVDRFLVAALEEERFEILRQERARLGIHDVEAVMIDEHRLLAQPLAPAILADLADDTGTQGSREWRTRKSLTRLGATGAGDGGHGGV